MGSGASKSGGTSNKDLFSLLSPCKHFLLMCCYVLFTPVISLSHSQPKLIPRSALGSLQHGWGCLEVPCYVPTGRKPSSRGPALPPSLPTPLYFPRACPMPSPVLGAGETLVMMDPGACPEGAEGRKGIRK